MDGNDPVAQAVTYTVRTVIRENHGTLDSAQRFGYGHRVGPGRLCIRRRDPDQRCRIILTFNPPMRVDGRWVISYFAPWLDRKHPNPALPGELRWFTTIGDNQDYEVPDNRRFVLVDEEIELFNPNYLAAR